MKNNIIKILVLNYFTGLVTEVTANSDYIDDNFDGDVESFLNLNMESFNSQCEWFVPELNEDNDIEYIKLDLTCQ